MTTYRIGLTGFTGRVGQELMKYENIFPLPCDVRSLKEVEQAVNSVRPDIIVHLAAISNVDECEKPENQTLVDKTNIRGTFHVAAAAEKCGSQMVLLSSSQVFDGKWGQYKENQKPSPVNYYGFSKMGAEGIRAPFPEMKVIRTSYLFDHERVFRHVYPLRAGQSYEYPTFIERSFMYVPHFVDALYSYLMRIDEMPDVLHIAGTLPASWFEFMKCVASAFGLDKKLICPRREELPGYTPRPYLAGLNVSLSAQLRLPQYSFVDGLKELREAS